MKRWIWASIALVGGCHAQSPSAPAGSLTVTDARIVLPAVPGHPAAGYFTLQNATPADATLAGVRIAGAKTAEMHETMGTQMRPLASAVVPAGGQLSFSPGGKHVMIFGLAPAIRGGSTVKMSFSFADGQSLAASAAIKPAGAPSDDMPNMNN